MLTTTLALRYAVGIGQIRGLVVGDEQGTPLRDVTYHDIMPFFGSSIAY